MVKTARPVDFGGIALAGLKRFIAAMDNAVVFFIDIRDETFADLAGVSGLAASFRVEGCV